MKYNRFTTIIVLAMLVSITTFARNVVIDVQKIAGGKILVNGQKAPGQPPSFSLFRCESKDGRVPLKGSCHYWQEGYINVMHFDIPPGYYFVLYSGSLYPDLVRVESGQVIELQLHNLTFRSSNDRTYHHLVFSDFGSREMRELALKFIWGTANVGAIMQDCYSKRSTDMSVRNFCNVWQGNDYRLLERSMVWFFEEGYYQMVTRSRSTWAMSHSGSYVYVIEKMLLEFSQIKRWVQASVETNDSVALFAGVYGTSLVLPNHFELSEMGIIIRD